MTMPASIVGPDVAFAVERLTKRFGGHTALRSVNLEVKVGEVHAIAGENGAGKSTLIKVVAGVHQPDDGEIFVRGERAVLKSPHDSRKLGFGFLHQQLDLVGSMSVCENLLLTTTYPRRTFGTRISWRAVEASARRALDMVGLNVHAKTRVADLTLAQQQLVALARVLIQDSNVIVLDEPTSSLGAMETEHLLKMISARKAAGQTVVFISHRLDEVLQIADRVSVLRDGQLVATVDRADLSRQNLVRLLGGGDDNSPRTETKAVGQGHPHFQAVNLCGPGLDHPVSLSIGKGEVLGLAGLVGSGRSTLADMLAGTGRVTGGAIMVDGRVCKIRSRRDAAAAGIAFVPADRSRALVPNFRLEENLSLGHLDRYCWRGLVIRHRAERRGAAKFIGDLKIKVSGTDRTTRYLSGGNQQKVVLARALDLVPSVLILDEPTAGIDIATKEYVYRLVRTLARDGLSILVISSELEELPLMADRILVFSRGRVLDELMNTTTRAEIVARLFQESR